MRMIPSRRLHAIARMMPTITRIRAADGDGR
jgi:hypothetical protein